MKLKKKKSIVRKTEKVVKTVESKETAYHRTLDLREWWEEFAHGMNKNGTQKYPTVWSFVKAKAKHNWQRDYLYWILGPLASEGKSQYPGKTQYDWDTMRERGFWFSSTNIEKVKNEITRKDTSFGRIQAAGDSLIEDLAELSELQKQLSKEFGGRLFLKDNTAEENSARAGLYMQLKKQIQDMKANILQTYAKTQGMDMNQLSNFLELFANGMGAAASQQLGYGGVKTIEGEGGSAAEKSYRRVLNQMSEMVMQKSAELELPLPDSEAERIVKEETTTNGSGKKRVLQ